METAFYTAAGLVLSGLGYLAVRHPVTYKVAAKVLLWVAGAIWAASLIYLAGHIHTSYVVIRFVGDDKFRNASTASHAIGNGALLVGVGCIGFAVVLLALKAVSDHIDEEKGRDKKDEPE